MKNFAQKHRRRKSVSRKKEWTVHVRPILGLRHASAEPPRQPKRAKGHAADQGQALGHRPEQAEAGAAENARHGRDSGLATAGRDAHACERATPPRVPGLSAACGGAGGARGEGGRRDLQRRVLLLLLPHLFAALCRRCLAACRRGHFDGGAAPAVEQPWMALRASWKGLVLRGRRRLRRRRGAQQTEAATAAALSATADGTLALSAAALTSRSSFSATAL